MMQDIDLGDVEENEWKCATFKQVVDLSEPTGELLKKYGDYGALKKAGEAAVDEALQKLLELEKKARLGGDSKSTMRLAVGVVNMLIGVEDYQKLMANVELLMKRRAQLENVQLAVVKTSRSAMDAVPEGERVPLIKKLRDICQGKIHVEKEFAQLSVELATMWEASGLVKEAAEIMLDVQVETIRNMSRPEKLVILLLQIRLNLDVKDYIRAAIMARKTTSRALSKTGSRHIKIKYYELMLRYYAHFNNYHYLAKCWMELYETAQDEVTIKELPDHPLVRDPSAALASVLVYVSLSPSKVSTDREQTDAAAFSIWNKESVRATLLKKYGGEKLAQEVPHVVDMSACFLEKELVHWPEFSKTYEDLHKTHPAFTDSEQRWKDMHQRVTEHNLKVISSHYTRIRMKRLAQLIDLSEENTEEALCKLVTDKDVWARVDRIEGVASFTKQKNANEVMVEFKGGIDHVLAQVTAACHLITKESVLHNFAKQP
eukprot:TRINITY_DN16313_c0_g1_i1.p1 TRINITY_DN16313_c0_g1~~TRINITY_DN16313_c0_g1_i1.p1  ORF type:complete len:488 (+),score=233.15 TRINITY_DN16313_c0_g1_i1:165-1628(+)